MEKSDQYVIQNFSFCVKHKRESHTILNNMRVNKRWLHFHYAWLILHHLHQQALDIIQLGEHSTIKSCHTAYLFTKRLIDSIGKKIACVCREGRALLFCSLNILPFTVTSLQSSALLIISFRKGSEYMHGRMCSFCLGVFARAAVWAHACMCASPLWTHLLTLRAF